MTSQGDADADALLEELFHGDLGFDEMIPVDSFFNSYVDQLQEVAPVWNQQYQLQQQGQALPSHPAAAPVSIAEMVNANSGQGVPGLVGLQPHQMGGQKVVGSNNKNTPRPEFMQTQFVSQADNFAIDTTFPSSLPPFTGYSEQVVQNQVFGQEGGMQVPFSQQLQQQGIANMNTGVALNNDDAFQQQFMYQQMLNMSGEGGQGMRMKSENKEDTEEEENSNDKNSGQSSVRRIRNRTPKQQAMNKQAQQRYRERKKSKVLNMEKTVEALTQEVTILRQVKEQKIELEDKASKLEQQLLEREAELNRLKAELHNQAKGNASTGSGALGDGSGSQNNAESATTVSIQQFDISKEAEDLVCRFHDQVVVLRDVMKSTGIETTGSVDIYGSNLGTHVIKKLGELVMDICMVCMRSLRMEGIDVWSMISASSQTTPNQNHCWNSTSTASRLGFTHEQKRRALILRKEYLKKLQEIFIERQGLNLQAISVLLPQDQGGQGPNLSAKGKFSLMGFFARAKHNGRLNSVLGQLRENLRAEQRAASELDYIVFHRLFTPLQAAWFVLECYPEHCDCLELLNGCDQAFGKEINIT